MPEQLEMLERRSSQGAVVASAAVIGPEDVATNSRMAHKAVRTALEYIMATDRERLRKVNSAAQKIAMKFRDPVTNTSQQLWSMVEVEDQVEDLNLDPATKEWVRTHLRTMEAGYNHVFATITEALRKDRLESRELQKDLAHLLLSHHLLLQQQVKLDLLHMH